MSKPKVLTKKDHDKEAISVIFDHEENNYKLITVKYHLTGTAFIDKIEVLDARQAVATMKSHQLIDKMILDTTGKGKAILRGLANEPKVEKHELKDEGDDL